MKSVNVAKNIVPLGDFKNQAARILKELNETDEPLVVTQNGRPAAVLLSPSAYELLKEHQQYLELVAHGLADAEAGQTITHDKVVAWLESWGSENESEPPL